MALCFVGASASIAYIDAVEVEASQGNDRAISAAYAGITARQ